MLQALLANQNASDASVILLKAADRRSALANKLPNLAQAKAEDHVPFVGCFDHEDTNTTL